MGPLLKARNALAALRPRCASRSCAGGAEWSGAVRIWSLGADRRGEPLLELRFPRICTACSLEHLRAHIASDAFWRLAETLARASRLPPPDRDSLETEFTGL